MCAFIVIAGKTMTTAELIKGFNSSTWWDNPGGGTSEILGVEDGYIIYRRGNTKMRVSIDLINKIYDYIITNTPISTKEIVDIKNRVEPNYKGWHGCDATFIMMIFRYLGLGDIKGKRPC